MASFTLLGSLLGQSPARSNPKCANLQPCEAFQAVTVPAGFGFGTFAETPGLLPTSLTFGPDGRLYVAAVQAATPDFRFIAAGEILAFEDVGGAGIGDAGQVVANGLDQVLGIAFGPDGTLYAADNANNKGRLLALRDVDGDGTYEQRRTVLQNIPNGRHQTNGMAFGPDGMIYLTNGSATDDGIECGPEPVTPIQCPTPEVQPWTGSIIRVNPAWQNVDLQADVRVDADPFYAEDGMDDESVLVAPGFRNIYDVDFSPENPSIIYTPMNGSDDPSSNEPLFRTDVKDEKVVGQDAAGNSIYGPVIDKFGFPSCLYGGHTNNFPQPELEGHVHPEDFTPRDNPNSAVTDRFGLCPVNEVTRPLMFFAEGHNGTTGLAFERGNNFPDRYDGDLFVGEWGSIWNSNGGDVTGHKITQVEFDENGKVSRRREFMTGVLPMDVTFGPDGAMYVADFQGLIYRVTYVMDAPDMATVEIQAGQFVPQFVAITHDVRVLWVNLDTVAHNVRTQGRALLGDPPTCLVSQGQDCSEMDSPGDIPPRGSHSYLFTNQNGVWEYQSTTNATDAGMQGAVIVLPVDR